MRTLLQDIRYGIRILLKSPWFALAAACTLGLGIAANAAVFSVMNAFLFRALPFREPQQLVHIWQTKRNEEFGDQRRVSEANFLDWKKQTRTMDGLGAYYYQTGNVIENDDRAVQVLVGRVTVELPSLLGAPPILGREFLPEEGQPGNDKVVLLSYGYWQRHYAGKADALGKDVRLDGENYRIVGVMPRSFVFPLKATQLWTPLVLTGDESKRAAGPLLVVGRLKPGGSIRDARAEMAAIAQRLQIEHPETDKDVGARVVSLREALLFFYDQFELLFGALFLASVFILLIVCANVGNLLLARALDRTREAAIRSALGASRGRLLRQFLTENVLLALAGAGVGLALTGGVLKLMQPLLPDDLYRVGDVGVNVSVLMFTLALSAAAVLLFGLAPALLASRSNLIASIGGHSFTGTRRAGRLRTSLVVVQIALAVVLLVGALLSVHAFRQQQRVDPGFATSDVLTFEVRLSPATYPANDDVSRFFYTALQRIAALPRVKSAAAVHPLPMNFQLDMQQFEVEGTSAGNKDRLASTFAVSAGYFETMRIPMLRGRSFVDTDTAAAPTVVVVNRVLAEQNWPNQDAIGKQIRLVDNGSARSARIIGVVGNSKDFLMHEPLRPQIFVSQLQAPTRRRFVVVHTTGNPTATIAMIRDTLRALDRDVSAHEVRIMDRVILESLLPFIAAAAVLGTVGFCALLLAAVGVFGVASYAVRQRTHEIGIRIALGADRRAVLKMVLADGLRQAGIGVGIGLCGITVLVPVVRSLLQGAVSLDAPALVAGPVLLVLTTLLACYLPARRATRVDPMVALRYE